MKSDLSVGNLDLPETQRVTDPLTAGVITYSYVC